jgi:hypothetical protein
MSDLKNEFDSQARGVLVLGDKGGEIILSGEGDDG